MKIQNFDTKFALAMKELDGKKVSQYQTIPLAPKLVRRFGFKLRPPRYRSFIFNAFYYTFCFAFLWMIISNLQFFRDVDGLSVKGLFVKPLSMGLVYGLFVAGYCKFSANHNSLTSWEEL